MEIAKKMDRENFSIGVFYNITKMTEKNSAQTKKQIHRQINQQTLRK